MEICERMHVRPESKCPSGPAGASIAAHTLSSDDQDHRSAGRAAERPLVWAIGGGKGGVGKSVIAANLAVRIGQRGRRVALVDADLGGANLHTILGAPNPGSTLSAFLSGRVADLEGVMAATPFEGVSLISGARALLEMANPKFAQKEKILRHILALDVDHVILDLGAGSAFNVLDFFLAAHRGILVIVPEPTSIENAYQFLKSSFFRKLKRARPRHKVLATVKKALHDADLETATSPRQLIERAERIDPDVGRSLRAEADGFSPALVLNRVASEEHRHLGNQIGGACRDYFGAEMKLLGCVDSDPLVTLSIIQRKPAVALFPDSPFSRAIDSVADRLLEPTEDPHGD